MRTITTILFLAALSTATLFAETTGEADARWVKAVEQKIASGNTTISTPSEVRAKAAEELARKQGRQVTVTKSEDGYFVAVTATK